MTIKSSDPRAAYTPRPAVADKEITFTVYDPVPMGAVVVAGCTALAIIGAMGFDLLQSWGMI